MKQLANHDAFRASHIIHSRRNFLGMLASLSASTVLSGCAGSSKAVGSAAAAVSAPALQNPQPLPGGPTSNVLLSVGSSSIGQIPSRFIGLSYEKSMMTTRLLSPENVPLVNLLRLIGPGVLRIGGNAVDSHVWTPEGAGKTAGQIAPVDVDAVAAFVKAAGWQCMYGVNLGGAATGATSPAMAAEEVAYAVQQFGGELLGVEIGNECEGYGAANSYFAGNWSLEQFISLWSQFRSAIVARTPGVAVAGPASGTSVSRWASPFTQAVTGQNISLITQHYYRGSGLSSTATVEDLILSDSKLSNCLDNLRTCSSSAAVPFRIAECNSYYDGGAASVSNTYASTLWSLDFLFACAQGGSTGVNLHGGGNVSYTPIADAAGQVTGVRPEFYGLVLFSLVGTGKLLPASLSGAGDATAYVVQSATGDLNIVIVNKDAQNLQTTLQLPRSVSSASLLCLTQSTGASSPDISETSGVTIQGSAISSNARFVPAASYALATSGSEVTCYVPAKSAVLIKVK